jgi:hypothetical protein
MQGLPSFDYTTFSLRSNAEIVRKSAEVEHFASEIFGRFICVFFIFLYANHKSNRGERSIFRCGEEITSTIYWWGVTYVRLYSVVID